MVSYDGDMTPIINKKKDLENLFASAADHRIFL